MTRVLLDEGAPRPLAARLLDLGIDAKAFPNSWKQLSNGKLLEAVEQAGFDVLLTNDKNLPYQQSLSNRRLAVVVLPSTNLRAVLSIAPRIADVARLAKAGTTYVLEANGNLTDLRSK